MNDKQNNTYMVRIRYHNPIIVDEWTMKRCVEAKIKKALVMIGNGMYDGSEIVSIKVNEPDVPEGWDEVNHKARKTLEEAYKKVAAKANRTLPPPEQRKQIGGTQTPRINKPL